MNELLQNLDKIHTTIMGNERISRHLAIHSDQIISQCKTAIQEADLIMHIGKNFYVYHNGNVFTVNAKSYTIITAKRIHPTVRTLREADYICLNEFLYQAIFIPKGVAPPERNIINQPHISIYIKGFGKQNGDLGVVAEQNGQIVGAAWTRIIDSYGHIDKETPELAISLLPEFRGYGVGTMLMKKLFALLREKGFTQTSLSVNKENPAVRFYTRLGYRIINETESHEDYLMIKSLNCVK